MNAEWYIFRSLMLLHFYNHQKLQYNINGKYI